LRKNHHSDSKLINSPPFLQDIFASAIKKLRKAPNGRQMEGVLGTSKNIFNFFINLAE
jgi:hypothetical protein